MRRIFLIGLISLLTACAAPSEAGPQAEALPATVPGAAVAAPASSTASLQAAAKAINLPGAIPMIEWTPRNGTSLRALDPTSGTEVADLAPVAFTRSSIPAFAFSQDGEFLAATAGDQVTCESSAGGSSCRGESAALVIVDLPAWKSVQAALPADGWASPLVFSPSGDRVALAYHSATQEQLMVYDAASGRQLAEQSIEVRASLLGFSQDGLQLLVYGQPLGDDPGISEPPPPEAVVLDAGTLELLWSTRLEGVRSGFWCTDNCDSPHEGPELAVWEQWQPAVAFAQAQGRLYIVHADEPKLTAVDLAERTVRTVDIRPHVSWLERLMSFGVEVAEAKGWPNGAMLNGATSADGSRLYVVGSELHSDPEAGDVNQDYLGLQVIDTASGEQLEQRDGEATEISLAPDGEHLFLGGWGQSGRWTEVVDRESLERVTRLPSWVVAVYGLDGKPAYLGLDILDAASRVSVLDPATFEAVHTWTVKAQVGTGSE